MRAGLLEKRIARRLSEGSGWEGRAERRRGEVKWGLGGQLGLQLALPVRWGCCGSSRGAGV